MKGTYVKEYDENGVLLNPITKENPWKSGASQRGRVKNRPWNNSKSTPIVAGAGISLTGKLFRYKVLTRVQFVDGKTIIHKQDLAV